jgi:hypothetical protein
MNLFDGRLAPRALELKKPRLPTAQELAVSQDLARRIKSVVDTFGYCANDIGHTPMTMILHKEDLPHLRAFIAILDSLTLISAPGNLSACRYCENKRLDVFDMNCDSCKTRRVNSHPGWCSK